MSLDRPIYLDHHATTPVDPRVLDAMLPYFREKFGNAASISHRYGWEAEAAVERAREQVAALIGAESRAIVFTSGATEANNLAFKGALPALRSRGNHLVSAVSEHRSVLDPLKRLAREKVHVTFVPCDATALVTPEAIRDALTEETVLVSVMWANNEVGTISPVPAIASLCRERSVILHTDATQAVGKIPLDVTEAGVDLLSFSAHKLYGPKGIGALYVRRVGANRPRIQAEMDGGGHERGMRSGTLPVPLVVGFGEAASIALRERDEEALRLKRLRDRLHAGIVTRLPEVQLHGHPTERLPGNLNLGFPGVHGEALMMAMKDVACSSGAACSAAEPEPSHVLKAIGLDDDAAKATLRFGLGRFTTEEEIDRAIGYVCDAVVSLRSQSPAWTSVSPA